MKGRIIGIRFMNGMKIISQFIWSVDGHYFAADAGVGTTNRICIQKRCLVKFTVGLYAFVRRLLTVTGFFGEILT